MMRVIVVLGALLVLVVLWSLLRRPRTPSHVQTVRCPACGWQGRVSRYAGRCPSCNTPLGDQRGKHSS